jgi:hypothetical protein
LSVEPREKPVLFESSEYPDASPGSGERRRVIGKVKSNDVLGGQEAVGAH